MKTSPRNRFEQNSEDVQVLLDIHGRLTGHAPGKRHGVDVLNRSALIFITACWEAYVEDLCKWAFFTLLKHSKTARDFPERPRNSATSSIFTKNNPKDIWRLAGSGWRNVMDQYLKSRLGRFNTPTSENISELFEKTIGLKNLPSRWRWKGTSAERAAEKLNRYIRIRGRIAHRTKQSKPVHKSHAKQFYAHIRQLVNCTERVVHTYLKQEFSIDIEA